MTLYLKGYQKFFEYYHPFREKKSKLTNKGRLFDLIIPKKGKNVLKNLLTETIHHRGVGLYLYITLYTANILVVIATTFVHGNFCSSAVLLQGIQKH